MSWRDDVTEARTRLEALEAAELKLATGVTVRSIAYDGERLEYSDGVSMAELRRMIAEVRAVIRTLTGAVPRGGAIIPTFRG